MTVSYITEFFHQFPFIILGIHELRPQTLNLTPKPILPDLSLLNLSAQPLPFGPKILQIPSPLHEPTLSFSKPIT